MPPKTGGRASKWYGTYEAEGHTKTSGAVLAISTTRSPSSALLPFFWASKIDYSKKGTLILTSLLEDLDNQVTPNTWLIFRAHGMFGCFLAVFWGGQDPKHPACERSVVIAFDGTKGKIDGYDKSGSGEEGKFDCRKRRDVPRRVCVCVRLLDGS